MIRLMARYARTWTDEQLAIAVAGEHSWRGVARSLGMKSTSSWALVHRRARELGLDASHFRGKRAWTNAELAQAIAGAKTWSGAARKVGAGTDRATVTSLKELALQMGWDVSHLDRPSRVPMPVALPEQTFASFGTEAEYLAAAWFASRGFRVSLAGSGLPYDLVIDRCGEIQRVQVKSTTMAAGTSGSVTVKLSRLTSSRGAGTNRRMQCYEPTDFDLFLVLTGEGRLFLIPLRDVPGLKSLVVGPESPYFVQTIGLSGRQLP
jgi:PD-(D/E)XK nuclease superfamily protein